MSLVPPPALLLSRREIATLMAPADYLAAVEAGFRAYAHGDSVSPMPMHIPSGEGGFHAKGASITLDRSYVALKVNGNFPRNPRNHRLPTIQGVLLLFDAANGSLLAVMDSIEITLRRTAAASALAARYLAREDAHSIAICGCGEQGRAQLIALADVLPLECAVAWDLDVASAERFAAEMRGVVGFDVEAVENLRKATLPSDIVVTATSAQAAFLMADCVSPGTFIAAVGADSPQKSELAPELLGSSKVVVDALRQCAAMGDLHHALDAGAVTLDDVHAELGDIVLTHKQGRANSQEIIVFDSTGVAIQDVASAAWIYRRAIAKKAGTSISPGSE
jgi:ornithine cyclodeaminase/alanine dehydrogenase-like protein (mu-crystallin family)